MARAEWPLAIALVTMALFFLFGEGWLADLSSPFSFSFILVWLFVAILVSAFAVVRHAEGLAVHLGEPFGTPVLTIAMSGMAIMMIAAITYAGQGESSLGRDTMLAIIMIVLNGLVGISLLLVGLRYHEPAQNLHGANDFLAVIITLSGLGLILPRFTVSSLGTTSSTLQAGFLIVISLTLYGIFLAIQTMVHRHYFVAPNAAAAGPVLQDGETQKKPEINPVGYHIALLLAYLVLVILLAKQLAVPIDYGINVLGVPAALGGLLVAILILSPESLAAVRIALANELSHSINLSLGTALSSITMTIPAVLAIGFMTDRTIILGLDAVDTILLGLTLVSCMITFTLPRTNVLPGVVHLLLFLAYIFFIFEK